MSENVADWLITTIYFFYIRLNTYFDGTQQEITTIMLEQIPGLYENIANIVDIPQTDELKTGTKEEKIAKWERLASQSNIIFPHFLVYFQLINSLAALTRFITGVYSVVLVSLMLRVQINLIGRYH